MIRKVHDIKMPLIGDKYRIMCHKCHIKEFVRKSSSEAAAEYFYDKGWSTENGHQFCPFHTGFDIYGGYENKNYKN